MDAINLGIIGLLREDPRAANKKIARALGIAEATVAARIRTLKADNVIRIVGRRRVRADPQHSMLALVELFVEDPLKIEAVGEALADFDDVLTVYQTSRRPELVAHVRAAAGPPALNDTIKAMASGIPHLVQLNTLPMLEIHRFHRSIAHLEHLPPPKAAPRDIGEALIALIEEDGRQSVRSLARRLGLSETAVRYRLPRALKETGTEIVLICDSRAMGYEVWTDLRVAVAPGALQPALDRLSRCEDIIVLSHIAGSYNLHTMVIARSVTALDAFVTEHIRKLPGLIDFAILRVPRVMKYNYNYLI